MYLKVYPSVTLFSDDENFQNSVEKHSGEFSRTVEETAGG